MEIDYQKLRDRIERVIPEKEMDGTVHQEYRQAIQDILMLVEVLATEEMARLDEMAEELSAEENGTVN